METLVREYYYLENNRINVSYIILFVLLHNNCVKVLHYAQTNRIKDKWLQFSVAHNTINKGSPLISLSNI